MGAVPRAVSALILLLTLSCAGPFEESGALRSDVDAPGIPYVAPRVVVPRVPGQPPLDVRPEDVSKAVHLLASQLVHVAADPDLARRRLLADAEAPPELEGMLLDSFPQGRIVLASAELTDDQQKLMVQQYFQHCQDTHGRWGDCQNVMEGHPYLTQDAMRRLACHFALAAVWHGIRDEVRGILDPQRLETAILVGVVTWAALVAIPEPFSKILAVGLTIAMTAYLGVDALENVIDGWIEMKDAVKRATTFRELIQAGEAYGKRMGQQTARLVVMLVMAAISEGGLANLPKLPKFNLASSRLAMATAGRGLEMVSEAQQASVTQGTITVVLAKAAKGVRAGVVALVGGANSGSRECREEEHHIGTVENEKATWNGGPWTPRLEDLFDRVGLGMESQFNKVKVYGHKGPHPQPYHEIVYNRLREVLRVCRGANCRQLFIEELKKLGAEISTPGTELNDLVTKGCGRRP